MKPSLRSHASALVIEAAAGAFATQGESCIAGSRLYVQRGVFDEVVRRLAEYAASIKLGRGTDPETQMGPLISAEHRDKVLGYLAVGLAEGAEKRVYLTSDEAFLEAEAHLRFVLNKHEAEQEAQRQEERRRRWEENRRQGRARPATGPTRRAEPETDGPELQRIFDTNEQSFPIRDVDVNEAGRGGEEWLWQPTSFRRRQFPKRQPDSDRDEPRPVVVERLPKSPVTRPHERQQVKDRSARADDDGEQIVAAIGHNVGQSFCGDRRGRPGGGRIETRKPKRTL